MGCLKTLRVNKNAIVSYLLIFLPRNLAKIPINANNFSNKYLMILRFSEKIIVSLISNKNFLFLFISWWFIFLLFYCAA